jgi:hypothetical protein
MRICFETSAASYPSLIHPHDGAYDLGVCTPLFSLNGLPSLPFRSERHKTRPLKSWCVLPDCS